MKRLIVILLGLVAAGIAIVVLVGTGRSPQVSANVTDLQSVNATEGFAKADRPRQFAFPQDHGPHPEYQTEWWYYTGNLDTADGRHIAYQLTFFRRAISPLQVARASDWATNQIYFAHFAITDVKNNTHQATERFSRGAAGLAGATGNPYRVWLENWQVSALTADGNSVRMSAEDSGQALELTLTAAKPPALEGDNGLSAKSADAGNASYYYSFTRLATEGTITVNGEKLTVKGLSWMDHEFGTTMLAADAVGWDWFSIQLNDQREIMFFQIRRQDGGIEPVSSGTLVEKDGTVHSLTRDQVNIQVLDTFKSKSGATYPARWNLSIPSANLQLALKPYVADQEMRVSVVYWEGAVQISGTSNGTPLAGSGFVEMTGYATGGQVPR
jgi:predicted secreted hydrolase